LREFVANIIEIIIEDEEQFESNRLEACSRRW